MRPIRRTGGLFSRLNLDSPRRDLQHWLCLLGARIAAPEPARWQRTFDAPAVEPHVPELSADVGQREAGVTEAFIRIESKPKVRQPGAKNPGKPEWQRQSHQPDGETSDPQDLEPS